MQRDGSSRKPAFSHGSNRTCPVLTQDLADSLDAVPPVTRPEPPLSGDERAMVTVWLDYQRATLEWKCEGLDDQDLVRRAVPPSTLSLLGLVRHMTIVEWFWFERIFRAGNGDEADLDGRRSRRRLQRSLFGQGRIGPRLVPPSVRPITWHGGDGGQFG